MANANFRYILQLPTTTNLLLPPHDFAPAYPQPILQGITPVIQIPINVPQSMMSTSTPNNPTNDHAPGTLEGEAVDPQPPTQRKTTALGGANTKETQQSSPPNPPIVENLGDVTTPSSQEEGWCRNRKYIERIPNGFKCTVCGKFYDRYNSTSYHVTIYHRSPSLKCEEPGCQFTTRKAKHMPFHKYYMHHIALPEPIDLGSSKCPLCTHISKSPSMLEKHINRHISDCNRDGRTYQCPQCTKQFSAQRTMYDHMLTHTEDKTNPRDQRNNK